MKILSYIKEAFKFTKTLVDYKNSKISGTIELDPSITVEENLKNIQNLKDCEINRKKQSYEDKKLSNIDHYKELMADAFDRGHEHLFPKHIIDMLNTGLYKLYYNEDTMYWSCVKIIYNEYNVKGYIVCDTYKNDRFIDCRGIGCTPDAALNSLLNSMI